MKSAPISTTFRTLFALLACILPLSAHAATPTAWEIPAAQLAAQITSILGPGQALIQLTNRSSIPAAEMPAIRHALEEALRAHGIKPGATESANTLRITLSENATERLWIAQIIEGNETQVAIVRLDRPSTSTAVNALVASSIRLERKLLWSSAELPSQATSPVVAAIEWNNALILLSQANLSLFKRPVNGSGSWIEAIRQPLPHPAEPHAVAREPRGILVIDESKSALTAYLPGERCTSNLPAFASTDTFEQKIECQSSDDPWPLAGTAQKAFYNAARNYFTGVLTSDAKTLASTPELPPFYSAIPVVASGTPSLLITGVDGKAHIATSSGARSIIGARDWGSDIAAFTSTCGSTAILASSSGEALDDSVRAYELRGVEAVSISEPMPLKGALIAINKPADTPPSSGAANTATALPSTSTVLAILRTHTQTGAQNYEVDRVSAICQ